MASVKAILLSEHIENKFNGNKAKFSKLNKMAKSSTGYFIKKESYMINGNIYTLSKKLM